MARLGRAAGAGIKGDTALTTDPSSDALRHAIAAARRHFAAGDAEATRRACEAVLASAPGNPDALHLLGLLAYRRRDLAAASDILARAAAAAPTDAGILINLGVVQLDRGRASDALPALRRACEIAPTQAAAWYNAARALLDLGRHDEAVAAYERTLALVPDDAATLNNLGAVLLGRGRAGEAVVHLRRAVALQPRFAGAAANLATALSAIGEHGEAVTWLRHVLTLEPDFVDAQIKLAQALRDLGRLDEARDILQGAVERHPRHAAAWASLGVVSGALAQPAASERAFRHALALAPDNPLMHSDMLASLLYRPEMTPARLLAEHRSWDARHAAPLKAQWRPHDNERVAGRPLAVGFISGNFGRHPVGYFGIKLIEHLPSTEFRTSCYATSARDDDYTARFRAAATTWVDAQRLDDEALAARVRADRIDILIDQDGHFSGNRLLVFARKPAPVQATWHGYPSTTGLDAIDWMIADRFHAPAESEPQVVERIVRLPDDWICYDPPPYAPQVTKLPAASRGAVTFAAFQNPAKINDECAALWARVLCEVPGSRLVLKYRGIDVPSTRDRLIRVFAAAGVAADRVIVEPSTPHPELLARYGGVDVALDTWPYSGSTTTCEALWMGVPVVTLPGPLIAGRHSLCHLSVVGLHDLIARDRDEFVRIAVGLAGDRERLQALRHGLRERVAASPLCDGARFARGFGDALRAIWADWLAKGAG